MYNISRGLAPVDQRVDSAVQWMNRYPLDKYYQNLVFTKLVDSNFRAF